jgi:hypothetical protein
VFSRKTYTNVFPDVGISNAIGFQSSTMDDSLMFHAASGSGIVVKPGQGLALVSGRTSVTGEFPLLGASSTFHNYDIEATILYYPPTVSGTFPATGDVDQGILYGPNGNDYTGTLEQPIPADVKLGVSYGANGTEFTGTYSGGGGGNTYSKSRVVNKG